MAQSQFLPGGSGVGKDFRLKGYLDGKVDVIEELDERRLYFNGTPGLVTCNVYSKIWSCLL